MINDLLYPLESDENGKKSRKKSEVSVGVWVGNTRVQEILQARGVQIVNDAEKKS